MPFSCCFTGPGNGKLFLPQKAVKNGRESKMNKSYATKIQFRNAAKKAGVSINANDEYSRMKASIRHDYDIDNKVVTPYDRKYNNIEAVGFELYSLTAEQAMKLHAAGFELQVAIVPDFHGTKRTAYIYRLPLAN